MSWGGDRSTTVWVGGIPEGVTQEEIAENFKGAGTVVKANLTKGRTGIIQFSTTAERDTAITMFNGSIVNGSALQVDVWTGKSPGEASGSDWKQKNKGGGKGFGGGGKSWG